jgi:signal transduction histidine kinase
MFKWLDVLMSSEVSTGGGDQSIDELRRELAEAHRREAATAEVLRVIGSSPANVRPVFETIVRSAVKLCDGLFSALFQYDGELIRQVAHYNFAPEALEAQNRVYPARPNRGQGAARAIWERAVVHIPDVELDPEYQHQAVARAIGFRSGLFVPMLREGVPIGAIMVARAPPGRFSDLEIELLKTFADQAVIAIENTRLFEEVQARTCELAKTVKDLEIASQHKSQFVANMSHELRTPLAAILGYAELMQEGFYGALSQKSMASLGRIQSNGKHLLGLINTVLDIAKIESGQFSLTLAEYAVESVVETVRVATESLAETKKLLLKTDVAKRLPIGLGDEQRLTQVLLNLVGNAIKFTDTGEVRITATGANGHFTVGVTDTGPGIPPEELKRVFEQFHQVDNSNTKAKGGTGLGLAISKQIVEMHGGRIWVESTLGKGATFQIPVRATAGKGAA